MNKLNTNTRLIMDVQISHLRDLQNKTGLDLKAVFNEALALYSLAVERKAEGKLIAVVDERTDTYSEIKMEGLQNVRPKDSAGPRPARSDNAHSG